MAVRPGRIPFRNSDRSLPSEEAGDPTRLNMAVNLLTEDPHQPSGAHWCWTRIVPEMASRLRPEENLYLIVSPAIRQYFQGLGEAVHYITFPWSNEHRVLRTASEHLLSPVLIPRHDVDLLSTTIAPLVNSTRSLVIHMKTMHAYTTPEALGLGARTYRRLNYQRSVRLADAIIVNSTSLRSEIDEYLEVEPQKISLIYEAVDHDIFKPGSDDAARAHLAPYGVSQPFILFVSSLWRYKNCDGLLRAWRLARHELGGRQLVVVGAERDQRYGAELHELAFELGIVDDVVFVGGVPNEETVHFYQAADLLVYPSFNETFGLPILEAMACGCPVVTSNVSSMPEVAGGAAILADPHDPNSIARSILKVAGSGVPRLRADGIRRAQQFSWGAVAEGTLDVYREVAERRSASSRRSRWPEMIQLPGGEGSKRSLVS
jgi:glycosyltransferase involved in cell wall biosynthesis